MANSLGISDAAYASLMKGASETRASLAANGTINGATPNQNLAAVINQKGNTTTTKATPYISANGTTDYHITGMPDTGASTPDLKNDSSGTNLSGGGGGGYVSTPMSAGQSYQPPEVDYAAKAAARFAASLAQKRKIAEQQKASADTAYNQQNLRTKDDRILGDFSRTQTATPFGNMGRKSFQEGLIGRERTQADADASAALVSQKANIDGLLAAYENASADEQVRIADELERADRSYKLDLDKFNRGNFESDRGFDQNQQVIDYNQNPNNPSNIGQNLNNAGQALTNQLNELKLGNYPAELKQQATLYEQQVKSGQMSNEAAAYNLKQLKDPNSAANRSQALDLQMKELEAKNLPETERLKLQQLKKTIAEIGVTHYKPQTAAEAEYDQQQVVKIKAEIEKIKNGTSTTPKVDSKTSTDTHSALTQDLADAKDAAEANALIEANRANLTDADYKDLKKQVIDKF